LTIPNLPVFIYQDIVVTSAVLVLKSLVQTQLTKEASPSVAQQQSPMSIISRLGYMIDDIRHPKARACAIWLVGQHAASNSQWNGVGIEGIVEWAPDVLRRTAKSFTLEVGFSVTEFGVKVNKILSRRRTSSFKSSL
jgi:AP-3 complex subunit beta